MLHRFLATAGGAAMILAAAALGQAPGDGEPILIGEEEKLKWFSLEDFRLTLDLSARYRDERRPSSSAFAGESRRTREMELRESLELAASGFLGHANLLEFDFMGRFTPTQRRASFGTFDPGGTSSSSREWEFEYLAEYDLIARILQEWDFPLTFFSRRSQTILSRPFAGTLESVLMEHGARVNWNETFLPGSGSVQYVYRDQETSSRGSGGGIFDHRLTQHTFDWQNTFNISDSQDVSITYRFDDIVQTGPIVANQSFQRHDAVIVHNLHFGDNDQHNLRSQLHFFDETGFFDITRLRLFEVLRLRHSDRFETRYDYTFDWLQRPGTDQVLNRGRAGFQHRLFESLVTTANIGASHLDLHSQNFTSTEIFGDVDFRYTKAVPYGRLTAGAGFRFSHQRDSDTNGAIQIINEPHTFPPSDIIVIQRRLIDAGSIIVTDASGVFTYSAGLDYLVFDFVDRVEIWRIIGGSISEGETVLISYRFGDEPGRTTDTFSMLFTVRYDFDEGFLRGLGVYGRYFQQDQWRENNEDLFIPPADIRELVVGADYRIGNLTLLGERTIHESAISPFRSNRFEARYIQPLGRGSALLLTGTWDDIDRYEDDIQTRIATLSGRWNQQIGDQLSMGLELRYRDQRDSLRSDLRGFEQRLDVTWRHRQTTVYGSMRNAWLDTSAGHSRFHDFFVGVRREF